MILPLFETLRQSFSSMSSTASTSSSASTTSRRCSAIRAGRPTSGTRSSNNFVFFADPHGSCRTRSALASWPPCCRCTKGLRFAAFYRTAFFLPTLLSFVIVGFIWKLILSPIWGVARWLMDLVGMKLAVRALARQAGFGADRRVAGLGLAVHRHSDDADLRRAPQHSRGGDRGGRDRRHHRLGAVLQDQAAAHPAGHRHHLVLTFVGNFNAFDLVYTMQGALAGPDSTRPISWAPSSTAPSSASSFSSAIRRWAPRSPPSCS